MKDVTGKRVLVVGLARSGHAVALCLRRHGAVVTITDTRPPHAFQPILPELMAQKIGVELGSQHVETFLRHEVVVVSPGVPWDLPQLQAAREHRIPVYPEVEAASWFLDGTLIGVTGSNGKTTTSTLIGKILEASGFETFVGGNIGVPLSTAVDRDPPPSFLVTELSSFQLEAIQDFRPHVAVFLNLAPNHLDRHPTMEAYAQAKRQIFRNQQPDDYAILNLDDPEVAVLAPALAARKVFFSRRKPLPDGVFVSGDRVIYRVGHLERVLYETRDVGVRGAFNLENALAATAAACVVGADFEAMRSALREFRGVEHRLEFVRKIRGVEFYNNSKATSVDAAVKSLEAFERGVHLILGGKDKGAPYAPLRPLLAQRAKEVLSIGAAAERIAKELSGAIEMFHAGDLATAVRAAFKRAEPGDTVLLAPACSSFDQFQDYEHRGRVFKELVNDLARAAAAEPGNLRKTVPVSTTPQSLQPAVAQRSPRPSTVTQPQPPAVSAPTPAPITEPVGPGLATASPVEKPVTELDSAAEAPGVESPASPGEPTAEARRDVSVREVSNVSTPEPVVDAVAPKTVAPGAETPNAPVSSRPEPVLTIPETVEATEPAAFPQPQPTRPEPIVALSLPEAPSASARPQVEPGPPIPKVVAEPASGKPLELVYVYEVGAEEMPPSDIEPPPQSMDEAAPEAPASLEELDGSKDEALPFEVREFGAAPADSRQESSSGAELRPATGDSKSGKGTARRAPSGEGSEEPSKPGEAKENTGPQPAGPGSSPAKGERGPKAGSKSKLKGRQGRLPGIE